MSAPIRLDLGSGPRPREGFQGVDVAKLEGIVTFDLIRGDRWPWKDGEVDELSSSHFIEHIPADNLSIMRSRSGTALVERVQQDRLLWFFDEAFRVIKPGGLFHLVWPALKSSDAFRDPTHRRFLPLEFTHYLSAAGRASMGLEHYETRCNWVSVDDTCLMHLDPHPLPGAAWQAHEANRMWDVQKAFSITLRAEK